MKILKNYKTKGEVIDGRYPIVEILPYAEIFAELPICMVDFNASYEKPALILSKGQLPTVIESEQILSLKLFHLFIDEKGQVKEVKKEEANYSVRLPHDTDIKKLIYNGEELVLVEKEEVSK